MAERDPSLLGDEPASDDAGSEHHPPARLPTDILDDAETTIRSREEVEREMRAMPLRPPTETPKPQLLDRPPVEAPPPSPALRPAPPAPAPAPIATPVASPRRDGAAARSRGEAQTVYVVGFWKRLVAGIVDGAIILPVGLLLAWIATSVAGLHLPPSKMRGPDFWIDLVLDSDPVLVTGAVVIVLVALVYLMVFQALMGRTLGMRLLKMKVIDVWGERPSLARCAARTAGYLASLGTVMLGFLWIGFDSEKRALHDWIAGTYVVRS